MLILFPFFLLNWGKELHCQLYAVSITQSQNSSKCYIDSNKEMAGSQKGFVCLWILLSDFCYEARLILNKFMQKSPCSLILGFVLSLEKVLQKYYKSPNNTNPITIIYYFPWDLYFSSI